MHNMEKYWYDIEKLFSNYAKKHSINLPTIYTLQVLDDKAKIYTQKELCEILMLPKQMVNGIIKNLWQEGYVVLKEAKDRRNKQIYITPQGQAYITQVLTPLSEAEDTAWAQFTPEEMQKFKNVLERYTDVLRDKLMLE